jgi:hypothetical protein
MNVTNMSYLYMKAKLKSNSNHVESISQKRENMYLSNLVDMRLLKDSSETVLRLFGSIAEYPQHWFEFKNPKSSQKTRFSKYCLAYNTETHKHDPSIPCPYCQAQFKVTMSYFTNAIIRDLQDNQPATLAEWTKSEKETYFKEKGSTSWTPVRVVQLPLSVISQIQRIKNFGTDPVTKKRIIYPIADEQFGCDIIVSYDERAPSLQQRYYVQKGDSTPLTEEEQSYLVYDIFSRIPLDSYTTAHTELKTMIKHLVIPDEIAPVIEEMFPQEKPTLAVSLKTPLGSQTIAPPPQTMTQASNTLDKEVIPNLATGSAVANDNFDDDEETAFNLPS